MGRGKNGENTGSKMASEVARVGVGVGRAVQWINAVVGAGWGAGVKEATPEQRLGGEVSTQHVSRGRDFQAEAPSRGKAGSKDGVARLTERVGEESRENRMETRWDGAVGHRPNFGFYSEQDGSHRSWEPKTNVI